MRSRFGANSERPHERQNELHTCFLIIMERISKILKARELKRDYRNSHEYQAYGNRLAAELGDMKHRALYIKLAKNTDRNILENARVFVTSQEHAVTKGKLFMWKLKQLLNEAGN